MPQPPEFDDSFRGRLHDLLVWRRDVRHFRTDTLPPSTWLAGRARSVGLGWVSILNPKKIEAILDVPESWSLVAYLCIGYPREEHNVPELERHGWQDRDPQASALLKR